MWYSWPLVCGTRIERHRNWPTVTTSSTVTIHSGLCTNTGIFIETDYTIPRKRRVEALTRCQLDIQSNAAITMLEIIWYHKSRCTDSNRKLTSIWTHKKTPYLALTCKLWGAFCLKSVKSWPHYNGIALWNLFTRACMLHWSNKATYTPRCFEMLHKIKVYHNNG